MQIYLFPAEIRFSGHETSGINCKQLTQSLGFFFPAGLNDSPFSKSKHAAGIGFGQKTAPESPQAGDNSTFFYYICFYSNTV